jgi:arginase family enzyme
VLDPAGEIVSFMPEPDGLTLPQTGSILSRVAAAKPVAGVGLTGLAPAPANAEPLTRLVSALGF